MKYPLCAHPDCYTCRALTAALLAETPSQTRMDKGVSGNDLENAGSDPNFCFECGEALSALRKKGTKYCSPACKQRAHRKSVNTFGD